MLIQLKLTQEQLDALVDDIKMNLSQTHIVNNVNMHPIWEQMLIQLIARKFRI